MLQICCSLGGEGGGGSKLCQLDIFSQFFVERKRYQNCLTQIFNYERCSNQLIVDKFDIFFLQFEKVAETDSRHNK